MCCRACCPEAPPHPPVAQGGRVLGLEPLGDPSADLQKALNGLKSIATATQPAMEFSPLIRALQQIFASLEARPMTAAQIHYLRIKQGVREAEKFLAGDGSLIDTGVRFAAWSLISGPHQRLYTGDVVTRYADMSSTRPELLSILWMAVLAVSTDGPQGGAQWTMMVDNTEATRAAKAAIEGLPTWTRMLGVRNFRTELEILAWLARLAPQRLTQVRLEWVKGHQAVDSPFPDVPHSGATTPGAPALTAPPTTPALWNNAADALAVARRKLAQTRHKPGDPQSFSIPAAVQWGVGLLTKEGAPCLASPQRTMRTALAERRAASAHATAGNMDHGAVLAGSTGSAPPAMLNKPGIASFRFRLLTQTLPSRALQQRMGLDSRGLCHWCHPHERTEDNVHILLHGVAAAEGCAWQHTVEYSRTYLQGLRGVGRTYPVDPLTALARGSTEESHSMDPRLHPDWIANIAWAVLPSPQRWAGHLWGLREDSTPTQARAFWHRLASESAMHHTVHVVAVFHDRGSLEQATTQALSYVGHLSQTLPNARILAFQCPPGTQCLIVPEARETALRCTSTRITLLVLDPEGALSPADRPDHKALAESCSFIQQHTPGDHVGPWTAGPSSSTLHWRLHLAAQELSHVFGTGSLWPSLKGALTPEGHVEITHWDPTHTPPGLVHCIGPPSPLAQALLPLSVQSTIRLEGGPSEAALRSLRVLAGMGTEDTAPNVVDRLRMAKPLMSHHDRLRAANQDRQSRLRLGAQLTAGHNLWRAWMAAQQTSPRQASPGSPATRTGDTRGRPARAQARRPDASAAGPTARPSGTRRPRSPCTGTTLGAVRQRKVHQRTTPHRDAPKPTAARAPGANERTTRPHSQKRCRSTLTPASTTRSVSSVTPPTAGGSATHEAHVWPAPEAVSDDDENEENDQTRPPKRARNPLILKAVKSLSTRPDANASGHTLPIMMRTLAATASPHTPCLQRPHIPIHTPHTTPPPLVPAPSPPAATPVPVPRTRGTKRPRTPDPHDTQPRKQSTRQHPPLQKGTPPTLPTGPSRPMSHGQRQVRAATSAATGTQPPPATPPHFHTTTHTTVTRFAGGGSTGMGNPQG